MPHLTEIPTALLVSTAGKMCRVDDSTVLQFMPQKNWGNPPPDGNSYSVVGINGREDVRGRSYNSPAVYAKQELCDSHT
jgi:hypothetical protein